MVFEYDKLSQSYPFYLDGENIDTANYDQAVYLTSIDYTANDAVSPALPSQRKVEFGYTERAITDTTDFLGANPFSGSQSFYYDRRLQAIATTVDSSLVRRYVFDYDYLTRIGIFDLNQIHYLTLKGVSIQGNDGSTFNLGTRLDYYEQWEQAATSNRFGLLKQVDTQHSGATFNKIEYDYAEQTLPFDKILDRILGTVRPWWLVSRQTQSVNEADPEAEPQTLTYHYDEVTGGPGQGPVVQISADGAVTHYGAFPDDYRRVAMHDDLTGRTTIQAFYIESEAQTKNPLAGRLAWTEVFTDPDEACAEKYTGVANFLCSQASYLTGQYLAYQQAETASNGDDQAIFVAPESVIQAIGPLDSGAPQDWTQTRYEYDANGNVSMLVELNDPANDSDGRATVMDYYPTAAEEAAHILNRLKSVDLYPTAADAESGRETADLSRVLSCTRFTYDPAEAAVPTTLTQETYRPGSNNSCAPLNAPILDLQSMTTFDAFGNVTASQGAAGNYQVEYDPTYFTFPITTTYPVGNGNEDLITTASYDPGFGLATQTVAMNEAVTKYGYDAFGRIISATNQAIEGNNTLYDYLYDDTGLTLTITQADGLDELTTAQRYNGLGQLQWSASEGENGQTIQTDYQYNQGRLWQESVPHYADVPLSSRLWTIYEYDDLDRPIRVTHPDGAIQQTQYTGWSQQRVIDENEHVIDYTRDALGRVLQVIAYTGTLSSPAPYATTVYTYNARGQATEVRDQAGNLTQMGYDSVGRVLQLDDPDQGEWTYQYSINGPLTQQISPREIILKFDYDLQNRLTLVRREILETGSETYAEFTYDNADSNGQGQRTSMTDASGYTTYTYDAAGRLITETREIDGIIYRTGFSYDPLNRVKSLTYPDPSSSSGQGGEVITYTYNNQGLLEGLTTLTGDLSITDLDYNALGQTTRLTGANGLNWQFGYHPTHLALEQATLAVGETSLAFGYEYDDAGMLERVYDNGGAISMDLTYTYDPLNRLQSVSGSAGGFNLARTYTYDPVGNLMSKDGLSYTYANPAGFPAHAPSQVGDFNFSYDATGNRSQRSQGSLEVGYRYDELNRLAYVISDTAVISGVEGIESVTQAVYDGDGQRIKRITAVGTTVTLGQHYEVFYPASLNQTAPLTNSDCLYPMSHNAPRLVVDSQGGRRLIYQAEQGLCGASLNAAGQVIEAGGSNGSAENGYTFFDLDRDDQDAVHYLWQDSFNGQPYLRVSGATVVSGTVVSAAALAVEGSTGLAHVVWADTGGSLTYAQAADNTVQANQTLASSGAAGPRVALDASNLAHVIWRQAEPDRYAILYRAIGGANETVSTENCPANEASAPVVAVDGEGQVYAAWVGSDSYDPSRSEPICYAVRAPGGGWTVSQLDRTSPSRHLELQVSDDGQTVYLLRGARAFLADELESKGDYSQETLYLERYQDGVWTTALVNTYPSQDGDQDSFTNSVLDGDLDIDAQGNAYVAWLDNGPTWEEEETLRLRTTQILSTTVPQITKHYYAAEQRIASRVDDDLYYTLSDPTGHATLFADSTGQAVGQILYDSFGGVVTSTLPTTLTTRLAGHLDSTGLLYDGQRYFDPMVGNYLQPSLVGGLPEGPQGLNRYNVGSGSYPAYLSSPRGNGGISPLIADAGESFLSNSTSAWIGNRLEPIPGRLAAATVGDWHWLRVQTYAFASGRYRAGSLAEFFQHQWFGPFKYHRFSQDAFGNGLHEALVRRLPDEADSLARSLSRSGASINWEPVFGSTAGRIWNSSFGLARNPRLAGLAEHFTVGKFSLGVVADIAVGGIVQGVKDYDLWSTDPWLATRRVGAAGGANATVGLLAGGATAGVFAGLVWAGVISTPPGWVIASTTIGTAVILDITIGDTIKEKWFWAFDADSP
jgi:YD repeat-containing protein